MIRYVALLSASEIALGSLVHGLHLPLGGHLLSLNESLLLTFCIRGAQNRSERFSRALRLSSSGALMKSLSPVGQRLTPMLAISMQGWLFAIPLVLPIPTFLGVVLGALLSSLWAFAQPILFAYFLFGKTLFEGVLRIAPQWGLYALAGLVALKAALAMGLCGAAYLRGQKFEDAYLNRLDRLQKKAPKFSSRDGNPYRILYSPWMLLSIGITVLAASMSGRPDLITIALIVLRALGGAVLAIWIFKLAQPYLIAHLKKLGHDTDGDLGGSVPTQSKPDRTSK